MREEVIKKYKDYGIDVNAAIKTLQNVPISIHCWQLDDVTGFEGTTTLTGGIQATGNYPGKPRNFHEFTQDLDFALNEIPGPKKLNLHAIYQSDDVVDRKDISPAQFKSWVTYAKKRNIGLDFNPTIFSSPMFKDGLSLSSPHKAVQKYWIDHTINSIKVSEYFARELNHKVLCNIWIPDGLKDDPVDRLGPRLRLKSALDEILRHPYDKTLVDVAVESKVFGIGIESFTVGSHEFYLNYAHSQNILCLLDSGHYHPTENVADKISSMLAFFPRLALHVSRPVRWDSDHVLKLNDDLQEIANELVKCAALHKTYIGLDFFDASINRVAALIMGTRNMQKALLRALLTPWETLAKLQDAGNFTELFALTETLKTLPWAEVWEAYLQHEGVSSENAWFTKVKDYEHDVMLERKD